MKRATTLLFPVLVLCAVPADADSYDAFPLQAPAEAQVAAPVANLCEHKAVREVARIDRDLKPVKQLYDIATNPTGFAIKQVTEHGVHIPPWVGYAMDPKGALRAKAIEVVRTEMKKRVGLQDGCAAELAAGEA